MASCKVILYKSKLRADGTHPLVLRIIKDRKPKYLFLGPWIQEKHWNPVDCTVRRSHPNSNRLNNLILKKLSVANDLLLENESKGTHAGAAVLKRQIKGGQTERSFAGLADEYISELTRQGKFTVVGPERSRIDSFKSFLNADDISIDAIDFSLISRYKVHLTVQELSKRTVVNHLITLRTLYNRAIKSGMVEKAKYPFGRDGIKIQRVDSEKIGLEKDELQAIIDLKYPKGSALLHTRNVFLVSFYFAGARISDVLRLKWSDLKDGRLQYRMGKNNKLVSIKVPDQATTILASYKALKRSESDFVFPELKNIDLNDKRGAVTRIRTATKRLNKYLLKIASDAGISKKVTNHIARHTFGNLAGDRIPIPMLQKLYRHSSMMTTAIYQGNFMHKETDEALGKVVNF